MSTVMTSHVWLDERGVAWLDDTNVKVLEVALERLAHGSSPEEIYEQHRGYLSLAQIHAALTYYYDHQASLDAEIDRQLADFDAQRAASWNSPARQRLRALGKRA
jgi:uncharacterized protein (DUF433 family)